MAVVVLEGLGKLGKCNDIGIGTFDFPGCSIAPEPTTNVLRKPSPVCNVLQFASHQDITNTRKAAKKKKNVEGKTACSFVTHITYFHTTC
jgi:hypothetical protein